MDLNQVNQTGEKKFGPIIATLVIVLVLIIAALYIIASKVSQSTIPDDNSVASDSNSTETGQTPGTSTDIQSLQNDLNNSTTGLDKQNF